MLHQSRNNVDLRRFSRNVRVLWIKYTYGSFSRYFKLYVSVRNSKVNSSHLMLENLDLNLMLGG